MPKALTTAKLDAILSEYESRIKDVGLQFVHLIGEQLLNAKQAIIEDTGDKRAPGFIDWSERKFGLKKKSTARYIKAYVENMTDLKKIWGHEKSGSLATPILPLPPGVFNVVYADPPWKYDFAETDNRKIENQYPTMDVEDIKIMALPVIADDAVLFMWATAPKLIEALSVIEAWGFKYKTNGVWDKVKIGMGYWFRGQHELLLVATRGSFSPPQPEDREPSVYREDRGIHSAKPDYYAEWISRAFPGSNKIELFARKKREGWEVFGNECI